MKQFLYILISFGLCSTVAGVSLFAQQNDLAQHVNPFLGTQFFGHTFPGASLPFAMVHLSPETGTEGWSHCAGYVYEENTIIGFSHTHWSGVGMVNGGDIMLMPTSGPKLQILPGPENHPEEGYRSRYDHAEESASPGYYSVMLKDENIKAELTSTLRAGFHRYTFPKSEHSRIILDLGHQIGNMKPGRDSEFRIINNNRIEGFKSSGFGSVYFVAEFSKSFQYYGTFDASYVTPESGASLFPYKSGERGNKIGAFVTFKTDAGEQVLVKVGISYTSLEGARLNLETEIPEWDFNKVVADARAIWNNELNRIVIDGASDDQKEMFYSAVYHSLVAQYINQDVDGRFVDSDGKIHIAKSYDFYGSFSCWDTYRTQHPLLTLIAPNHVNDFIRSIEEKTRNYGWLPAQHFQNVFGEAMVGDHLIPVIVDAHLKGYRGFDVNFLYAAMRKKALETPNDERLKHSARSGLEFYLKLGYTPVDKVTESVPNTMELAYDDWCIAQLARALGKESDYQMFMKRALNYQNLWDRQTRFMRPRKADGTFLEAINGREQDIVKVGDHAYYKYFDPMLVGRRPNRHYTESNAWQYIWSVQHDVQGLINLFGGNEQFAAKLDTFFEMDPNITPPKYVGVVGTIGQYVHGNQPSHHVAYLYNYAGQPWKTQERARQVMEELYRPGPGGLCGNEDMGSLSSWYILSAMGIYPVTPGSTTYTIGSPLFGKVAMKVNNGKIFTVVAANNSKENKYIQSATLNGKALSKTWITQDDIVNGGSLVFQMGPQPNKKWGTKPEDAPPSMSMATVK